LSKQERGAHHRPGRTVFLAGPIVHERGTNRDGSAIAWAVRGIALPDADLAEGSAVSHPTEQNMLSFPNSRLGTPVAETAVSARGETGVSQTGVPKQDNILQR
jgi:hypothetical protein